MEEHQSNWVELSNITCRYGSTSTRPTISLLHQKETTGKCQVRFLVDNKQYTFRLSALISDQIVKSCSIVRLKHVGQLIKCFKEGGVTIVIAPTGTGKSLSVSIFEKNTFISQFLDDGNHLPFYRRRVWEEFQSMKIYVYFWQLSLLRDYSSYRLEHWWRKLHRQVTRIVPSLDLSFKKSWNTRSRVPFHVFCGNRNL